MAENHSVVVDCRNEVHRGCNVSVSVHRSSVAPLSPPVAVPLNGTAVNVTLSFPHGALVVADFTGVDGAGNAGHATLTWSMETLLPVTVWPSLAPFVNDSVVELGFNCSKVAAGCTFMYNLDGAGMKALGNSTAGPTEGAGSAVDTVLVAGPSWASRSRNATFVFDAVVPPGNNGSAVIDVRLDGAALWTTVAVNATYAVTDLAEGAHLLEARARYECPTLNPT